MDTQADRVPLLTPASPTTAAGLVPGLLDQPLPDSEGRLIAVEDGELKLSYTELVAQADALATTLRRAGLGPGTIIGILLPRSAAVAVATLAVLRAGAAYLPLDPRYPEQRLRHMLEDAGAPAVVTTGRLRTLVAGHPMIIELDSLVDEPPVGSCEVGLPVRESKEDELAYIIYTSGSTGAPKGVEMARKALSGLLSWQREQRWADRPRTCQFAPLGFDVSFQEIFSTWDLRGTLVIAPEHVRDDGAALLRFLCEARIERLFLPPVALQHLAAAARSAPGAGLALREVIAAGEQLVVTPVIREFFERTGCVLENHYGPTETHIVTSFRLVPPAAEWPELPPIGKPLPHVTVTVADADGRPVAPGEQGELLVGGDSLAHGYRNQPELTARRFTLGDLPAGRRYHTGDQVRQRSDGELEYFGRLDHQVKINGFRVELGEVEAVVGRHPGVFQVAAATSTSPSGVRRLVAYVVAADGASVTPAGIREHAALELPPYAVPRVVVPMLELPVTASGKLDRAALPAPWYARAGDVPYLPPRTPLQKQLVGVWESVLGTGGVGVGDDLTDLGADSLVILQLVAHLRHELDVLVEPAELWRHSTILELADALGQNIAGKPKHRPLTSGTRGPRPFARDHARPLPELIRAGALPRLDAAALSYLPTFDADERVRYQDWHRGEPVLTHVVETADGTIGLLALPIEAGDLYTSPKADLVAMSTSAIETAGDLGARAVTLTGLLASALDFGRDLAPARGLPRVTTGHGATVAAVVLNMERLLDATGRTTAREEVAAVGLGSIGRSALLLMLDVLPHPARLVLYDRSPIVGERAAAEVVEAGYRGELVVATAENGTAPQAVYDATFLIGATSTGNAFDLSRVRPGTVILDDSWPRSFDIDAAVARMTTSADIIATEAGELHTPSAMTEHRFLPDDSLVPLMDREELIALRANPHEVMGCLSAGLFVTAWDLPTTIGLPTRETSRRHYDVLRAHGFRGADPHLTGHPIAPAALRAFRESGHGAGNVTKSVSLA
ncbi:amino acid adenylation domain-containing protein [Amycolatopsis sp. NPDC059021]|uniref:amino acid adenylation domain-containing protein n=1 Tax=Amycolatopsis sp. NPDC059021 TaxID=3346704 RepID=UPI00366E040F